MTTTAPAVHDGIWSSMEHYRDALVAAGIRATVDPGRVDPPCVLIVPETGEFNVMCDGDAHTEWVLWVLGGQPGRVDTMRALSRTVAGVLQTLQISGRAEWTTYRTDDGDAWPACRLSFETVSSWIR